MRYYITDSVLWVTLLFVLFLLAGLANLIIDVRTDNRIDRKLRREEKENNIKHE